MRIGLIIYGLDRPLTGIGRYTLELVQALHALSPRPDIVLLCCGDIGPLADTTSFPRIRLAGCRLLPGLITLGNLAIPLAARRFGLDVVHDPIGVTPLLFGAAKARTVVTVHDVFAWSCPGTSSTLDTLIYKHWLPRVLPTVDAVVTVSQQSRTDVLRFLHPDENRLRIVPYGVASRFRPQDPAAVLAQLQRRFDLRPPYVLFVGALTKRKNVERALEAFAQVRGDHPGLRFVLAGPRAWKQTPIEAVVERLAIQDSVQLTGPLTDADLPALYSGASMLVFPSLYEGFGLPVLEAMACGVPVLTSNVSSLPEVVGDAGIMVDPRDVGALAAAMREVLGDRSLAAELRQRGLQRAAQFEWRRTASETVRVYASVLGRTSTGSLVRHREGLTVERPER